MNPRYEDTFDRFYGDPFSYKVRPEWGTSDCCIDFPMHLYRPRVAARPQPVSRLRRVWLKLRSLLT